MKEVLLQNNDTQTLDVEFETQTANLLAFFQNSQNSIVHMNVIHLDGIQSKFMIHGRGSCFFISPEEARSFEFDRFFANTQFFVDSEKDLSLFLHYLPIERENIHDARLAKMFCKNSHTTEVPFFKFNIKDGNQTLNHSYIKSFIIKGMDIDVSWKSIVEDVKSSSMFEIYRSIIAERFQNLKLYNAKENNLEKISHLYNVLPLKEKSIINEILEIMQQSASQLKLPLSNLVNMQAIEVIMLKFPKTFDDISHISGFNKKLVHSAVVRKILGLCSETHSSLKRNRSLETILDGVLALCAAKHGIEKSLISSKHDIIACLNGNADVSFTKGWKKEVFGNEVLAFLENRSLIESKNMEVHIVKK